MTPDEIEAFRLHREKLTRLVAKTEGLLEVGKTPEEVRVMLIQEGFEADVVAEAIAAVTDGFTGSIKTSPDVEKIRASLWKISQEPKMSPTERNRAISDAVVAWLHTRGRFYHRSEYPEFAGVMYFDSARKLLLPVQSDAFQAWLADCLAMNRSERSYIFVQSACETEGLSPRSTGIEPSTFWASSPTAFYLSNGPGHMAKITAENVEIVDNGTDEILFPFGATLARWDLTGPVDPFEACELFRSLSTTAPHGRDLFKLWVCSLPSNQRTKPPLVLSGTVGSGKTRLIRGVFELYGMPPRVASVLKNGDVDFWAAMDAGGLACFDNADTKVDWLADALAAAATAGTHEKRKLYTDSDCISLKARSWVCITSSSPSFASDPGLSDRIIVVRLDRRVGQTAETVLSDEIAACRDAGLSWICWTLATALAETAPVQTGLNARHPDFASLAVRIGRALNIEARAVAALQAAEADKALFNLENDWIGNVLLELLKAGPFSGTAAEMLEALIEVDPSLAGKLSTKRLSLRLQKMWPHIENICSGISEIVHGGVKKYTLGELTGDSGDSKVALSINPLTRENI